MKILFINFVKFCSHGLIFFLINLSYFSIQSTLVLLFESNVISVGNDNKPIMGEDFSFLPIMWSGAKNSSDLEKRRADTGYWISGQRVGHDDEIR